MWASPFRIYVHHSNVKTHAGSILVKHADTIMTQLQISSSHGLINPFGALIVNSSISQLFVSDYRRHIRMSLARYIWPMAHNARYIHSRLEKCLHIRRQCRAPDFCALSAMGNMYFPKSLPRNTALQRQVRSLSFHELCQQNPLSVSAMEVAGGASCAKMPSFSSFQWGRGRSRQRV